MSLKYCVELSVAEKTDKVVFVGFNGEMTKLTNIRAAEAGHLLVRLNSEQIGCRC